MKYEWTKEHLRQHVEESNATVGPFPQEPAFRSPEAVQRAAEWICKLDPKGIELPAIVEPNGHGGAFYVGQFKREGDAQLCSAAREMAEALEERLGGQEKAERIARLIDEGEYFPERTLRAVAALRKAGRLGGGR